MSLNSRLEKEYNTRLKKHGATWRLERHKDRIWVIKGRWTTIQPWSVSEPQTLAAACIFDSPRRMTARLKEIQSRVTITIRQRGDQECIFTFHEADLPNLQKPLGIYRRRKDYQRNI